MHHHCAKTSHAVQTDDRKRTDGRGPAAGIPFCDVCLQKEGLLIEISHLRMVPWPASKKTTKQLINQNFMVSKNREYHPVYQANVSQFRFESASGSPCEIRSYSRQFPVSRHL